MLVFMKNWTEILTFNLHKKRERKVVISRQLKIDYMESPTFSPDGSQIAFDAGFDDELYDI